MPELPEVEITARRLDAGLRDAEVESALSPGMVALKSFDPPLSALEDRRIVAVRRVGKMPVVEFAPPDGTGERIAMLVHLMSAGRRRVFAKGASWRPGRRESWCALPTGGSCACASSGRSSGRGRRSCRRPM